jgi:putative hydrolase
MAGDDDRRIGFGPNGPGGEGGSGGEGGPGGPGGPGGFGAGGFDPSMFGDPAALGAMFGQLQRMFTTGDDGPVNWELAHDAARQAVAGADPSPSWGEQNAVAQAGRLAELWLDPVTSLPPTGRECEAWSRAQWVEATLPTWRTIVTPVAEKMSRSMGGALGGTAESLPPGLPPEMAGLLANAGPMMQRLGGGMLGMQIGQAVGRLATEAVSATDIGLPLHSGGMTLVPANVAALSEGLGLERDEVRLFLLLREAAHARLFAHVPWLAPRLLGAVEAYAAGIDVDPTRIQEMLSGIDPTNPEALQEALSSGLLQPAETPTQLAAKARLENLLALVEGWVDTVVAQAATGRLSQVERLREAVRRRRAAGGPAEQTFAALVGLELRPRRMREAAAWWVARGDDPQERDEVWAHPDLVPDLDDTTETTDTFDEDLRRLVEDAESDEGSDGDPGEDGRPGA